MSQRMDERTLFTQLRTTLVRLEAALAAVEEGMAFTDQDGVVEWTNAAFDRLVGRLRFQSLGCELSDLLPEHYPLGRSEPMGFLRFWESTPTGQARLELSLAPPRRVLDVSWVQLNLPNKPSLVFTFRDQSAIVQSQDNLQESLDGIEAQVELRTHQLEQIRDDALAVSKAKTKFLASMSHEIRTPLNAVIGMAELLIMSHMDPGQNEMVETILCSCEHLLSLINDILDISQIETGCLKLNPRSFDLHDLILSCHKIFRNQEISGKLALQFSIADELPQWLHGDDLKLRQILINLLGNAFKYTNAGTIRLSTEMGAQTDNEVELLIRVTDTGIGIEADRLPFIFQEISRHCNPDQTSQSSGLGLAICSRLCQKMGGTITLETRVGGGSCFTVRLPFLVAEQPRPIPEPAVASDGLQGVGILVADDSRLNQRVLELMLAKLNLQPELVSDGDAAIARIEAGGIDLVFMDIEMPRLDGMAATRRLRAAGFSDLYVIALTAFSFNSLQKECVDAGMNDLVTKPLRNKDLIEALNRFRYWKHTSSMESFA